MRPAPAIEHVPVGSVGDRPVAAEPEPRKAGLTLVGFALALLILAALDFLFVRLVKEAMQ